MVKTSHIFSEELYIEKYGKPKGANVWFFGDKNECITVIRIGSEDEPVTYAKAKKLAEKRLQEEGYPLYKTVYLLPINELR